MSMLYAVIPAEFIWLFEIVAIKVFLSRPGGRNPD